MQYYHTTATITYGFCLDFWGKIIPSKEERICGGCWYEILIGLITFPVTQPLSPF